MWTMINQPGFGEGPGHFHCSPLKEWEFIWMCFTLGAKPLVLVQPQGPGVVAIVEQMKVFWGVPPLPVFITGCQPGTQWDLKRPVSCVFNIYLVDSLLPQVPLVGVGGPGVGPFILGGGSVLAVKGSGKEIWCQQLCRCQTS